MEAIKERAEMQLRAIEMAYSIEIQNREEIAQLIADSAEDKMQVLIISTSINSWIASNSITSDVVIPLTVISKFIESVK
jgi:hypothetical protein